MQIFHFSKTVETARKKQDLKIYKYMNRLVEKKKTTLKAHREQ